MHFGDVASILQMWVRFTGGILGTNEDVGGLGQPLHELGDALRVILSLTQRAHHGAQDPAHDLCEQLRVERFGCTGRVGSGVRPCSTAGRWSKDGLGLQHNHKKCCWKGRKGKEETVVFLLPLVKAGNTEPNFELKAKGWEYRISGLVLQTSVLLANQ